MTEFELRRLDLTDAAHRLPDLVDLYREAYSEPPYNEGPDHVAAFVQRFAAESAAPGFALVVVEIVNEIVGFAYGHSFASHEWWTDADQEPAEVRGQPSFAVMEFIVHKPYRGRGIGAKLMTALLADRPEPYATLCANPDAPARGIYRRWGWRAVARARPPGFPIMDVLLLPLPGPAHGGR